jgi:hypothetical protein
MSVAAYNVKATKSAPSGGTTPDGIGCSMETRPETRCPQDVKSSLREHAKWSTQRLHLDTLQPQTHPWTR